MARVAKGACARKRGGAARPVQRREHARIGKRKRVGRAVGGFDEREPRGSRRRSAAVVTSGRSALTTSAGPLTVARPASTAAPWPPPGSASSIRARWHDDGVVGHDDDPAERERGLDDVAEHRHRGGRAQLGWQTPLGVAAIGDHDRGHAEKRTHRPTGPPDASATRYAAFDEAPGPGVAHSRTSNQCVPREGRHDLRVGVRGVEDVMLEVAADLDLAERDVRDVRQHVERELRIRDRACA